MKRWIRGNAGSLDAGDTVLATLSVATRQQFGLMDFFGKMTDTVYGVQVKLKFLSQRANSAQMCAQISTTTNSVIDVIEKSPELCFQNL